MTTPEEKRLVDDLLSLAQIETQVKKMYAMADVLRWRGDAELSVALYKAADAIEAALAPIQRHTDEAAALVKNAKAIITKLNESGVAVERRMLESEAKVKELTEAASQHIAECLDEHDDRSEGMVRLRAAVSKAEPEHDCNRDHPDADVYHPQPGDWSERFRGGMLK